MMTLDIHKGWMAFLIGSAFLLAGCVDVVESDEYEPVDTQVPIHLSFSAHPGFEESKVSRMTGNVTQQENNFRDIYQMKLFAFTTSNPDDRNVDVDRVFTPITITNDGGTSIFKGSLSGNTEKAGMADNVSMYIGTNHCLGYAVTNQRPFGDFKTEVTLDDQFENGVTLTSWNTLKAGDDKGNFDVTVTRYRDFYFGPKSIFPIYPGHELVEIKETKLLLNWLNRLMVVTGRKSDKEQTYKTWWQVAEESLEGNSVILKSTYEDFVKNSSGAFENMRSLLGAIYNRLGEVQSGEAYYELAQNLRYRILTPVSATAGIGDLTFTMVGPTPPDTEKELKLEAPAGYEYPRCFGLPDGAIVLTFDAAKHEFSLKDLDDQPVGGETPGFDGMPVQAYSFPAEMIYSVKTPLKTTTQENVSWSGAANWAAVVQKYAVTGVQADSKSAVLELPFEYLVSCLETRAYILSDDGQTLPDKAGRKINIPDGGYPVTGILVGMQRFVGWDGKVIQTPSNALPETQYLTYDRSLHDASLAKVDIHSKDKTLSYTLLLESSPAKLSDLQDEHLGKAVGEQTKQMVVLELENTGADFRGHNNMLITRGMRFYLVGELNMKTMLDTQASQFPDSQKEYRIFEQGRKTQATLKITTLSGAYNCIPDLRNPSLQISLKTDWNWQNGLIYDDNIPLP